MSRSIALAPQKFVAAPTQPHIAYTSCVWLFMLLITASLSGCELLSKLEPGDDAADGLTADTINGSSSGSTDNPEEGDTADSVTDAIATGGNFATANPLETRLHPGSCFASIAATSAAGSYRLDAMLGGGVARSAPLLSQSGRFSLATGPQALQSDPLPRSK